MIAIKLQKNKVLQLLYVYMYMQMDRIGYVFNFRKIHAFLICFYKQIQLLLIRHMIKKPSTLYF